MTSSLARSLAILDLFTDRRRSWTADDISEKLGCSRPTGYRYVRELLSTGLLRRLGGGVYSLGPRIIELDYSIRNSDPLLLAGLPVIRTLVASTGFDVVLVGRYLVGRFEERIVTLHHEAGSEAQHLAFGRGRPLPLFLGAGSKIIVAHLTPRRLKTLYEARAKEAQRARLGGNWTEFREAMAQIRQAGTTMSKGEIEPGFVAIAAPVFNRENEVLGAVMAAFSESRLTITDVKRVTSLVSAAAKHISMDIAAALRGASGERHTRRRVR